VTNISADFASLFCRNSFGYECRMVTLTATAEPSIDNIRLSGEGKKTSKNILPVKEKKQQ